MLVRKSPLAPIPSQWYAFVAMIIQSLSPMPTGKFRCAGYIHEVIIASGTETIARHKRSYEKEDSVYDPLHYLPLLEQKIGALDQAAPLKNRDLPSEFATLHRLLEARMGKKGKREYVQVLRLRETFTMEDVLVGIKNALNLKAIAYDTVSSSDGSMIMTDTPQILLHHHLKKLRLPTFMAEYEKLAGLCASENKNHIQYLSRLTELEMIERERRMIERRIKAAKFPAVKSLDSFDFKAMPSHNKPLVMELARCEYMDRYENIIALGPSGTGKTHIALGLGLAACQKGLKVRFITAAALVHELIEAR